MDFTGRRHEAKPRNYIILYYIILYYIILYYIILHYITLHYITLRYIILYLIGYRLNAADPRLNVRLQALNPKA